LNALDWQSHFDDNRSIWLADKEPYVSAARLDRDLRADVAIIGGGFTGVSTAYHLSKRFPEKAVVLLEARVLGNGASGRSGGQMLNWVHGFDAETPEKALRIYGATREAIDTVLEIVAEHRLDVPHRRDGHLEVYTDPRNADRAEETVSRISSWGIPLRYLRGADLRALIELEGVAGAVFDPLGGQLDGVAYLRALRPVLERRGVRIFENTPALAIGEGTTVEIATPEATVKAGAIVLATNAYTPHLGYFGSGLFALHSHVIGTGRLDDASWARLGWKCGANFIDDRKRLSYGTLTADGRLLFGGGSNASYHYAYANETSFPSSAERGFEEIGRRLLAYLPRMAEVPLTARWTGPLAITLSRLCSMGVRGDRRNIYYALGYSGHGVTLANLAGRVITDIYSGCGERWEDLPFYGRKLRYIPPEPFRFLGYHLYTKLTGRSPRVAEN
jgi:glycine/D-amino acid oxidase-like deaminating enzyme